MTIHTWNSSSAACAWASHAVYVSIDSRRRFARLASPLASASDAQSRVSGEQSARFVDYPPFVLT